MINEIFTWIKNNSMKIGIAAISIFAIWFGFSFISAYNNTVKFGIQSEYSVTSQIADRVVELSNKYKIEDGEMIRLSNPKNLVAKKYICSSNDRLVEKVANGDLLAAEISDESALENHPEITAIRLERKPLYVYSDCDREEINIGVVEDHRGSLSEEIVNRYINGRDNINIIEGTAEFLGIKFRNGEIDTILSPHEFNPKNPVNLSYAEKQVLIYNHEKHPEFKMLYLIASKDDDYSSYIREIQACQKCNDFSCMCNEIIDKTNNAVKKAETRVHKNIKKIEKGTDRIVNRAISKSHERFQKSKEEINKKIDEIKRNQKKQTS